MSEGGMLAWRRQTVNQRRGPAADYEQIRRPLPSPPAGSTWVRDSSTGEWSVVPTLATGLDEAIVVSSEWIGEERDVAASAANGQVAKEDEATEEAENLEEGADRAAVKSEEISEDDVAIAVVISDETEKMYVDQDRTHIEHHIDVDLDTFQGICLRYKVKITDLCRANGIIGRNTNLRLMPNPLKIPINDKNRHMSGQAPVAPQSWTKDQAVMYLLRHINGADDLRNKLSGIEARTYLELSEWDYDAAVRAVKDDLKFEKSSEAARLMENIKPAAERTKGAVVASKASMTDCCFW